MSIIATARSFIFREDMPLTIDEINLMDRSPVIFQNKYMTVHAFEILPQETTRRKRSLDELQTEKYKVAVAQDYQQLQTVLSGMFNSQRGSLDVSGDDVDYLISLESRLKEDAERIRLQQETEPDEEVEPTYVDLYPPESPTKKAKGNGGHATSIPDARPLRRPWPASAVHTLPNTRPSQASLSYVVSMPPRRGKFNHKKAVALGVKPGPDFARLVAGEVVMAADGKSVNGKDCVEPDIPTPSVAILDIPSTLYVSRTIEEIKNWLDGNKTRVISCYTWILGEGVEDEPLLQSFLKETQEARVCGRS